MLSCFQPVPESTEERREREVVQLVSVLSVFWIRQAVSTSGSQCFQRLGCLLLVESSLLCHHPLKTFSDFALHGVGMRLHKR